MPKQEDHMTTSQHVQDWRGLTAFDADGEKVGTIDEVYLDRDSEAPEWLTVRTGLFGSRTSFVPVGGAELSGDDVRLAYRKDQIKDAPNVDADGALSTQEEQQLYAHYGREDYGDWSGENTAADAERSRDAGGDDAMTRSEEELRVGTREREAGRVRLKKYVVEDQVTQTVPVRREEVRVEREPITEGNRGDALDGPEISEGEHEVVLHAEEPVVEKRAVPKERVRLDTAVRTEEHEVSETVRKERIDVDDDAQRR
jgi:uncharacterized protein (TIGR02271 family)